MIHTLSRRAKAGILFATISGMFLAALDQTIVSTALPKIVNEFRAASELSWVVSAYLLATAVAVPITSKLSDIFGRKRLFYFNVGTFLLGSVLCGISTDIWQLIGSRAVQGIGGGGLLAAAFTIIADIFPPRERGKWVGLIGAVFGLSSVIGPTLGGYLTDTFNWRYIFLINVPVGIAALIIATIFLPNIKRDEHGKIDWLGSIAIGAGVTPLILALNWGGHTYAWGSWQILSLIVASVVFLAVFAFIETKVADPILPPRLFGESGFVLLSLITLLAAVLLFGGILYIPVFVQQVVGQSATNSGLILLPLSMAVVIMNIVSGQIVARTGKYKLLLAGAFAVTAVGALLLSRITPTTSNATIIFQMIVLGLGIGPTLSLLPLITQNLFTSRDISVVTGASTFFRTIGGAIGASVLGTLFTNRVDTALAQQTFPSLSALPAQLAGGLAITLRDPDTIQSPDRIRAITASLPGAAQDAFTQAVALTKPALAYGVASVFTLALGVSLVCLVIFLFVRERELKAGHDHAPVVE